MPKEKKTKKKVLGIKIRGSPDMREEEKRRKAFETVLQQVASNHEDAKKLSLPAPSAIPLENYYSGLITALSSNRSLTSIDTSACPLSSDQICEIMTTLNSANNFSLRRIDFSNSMQTTESVREIYKYVKQHLHLSDFKFKDPFVDATCNATDSERAYSFKIHHYLYSNRKMQSFLKGETMKFECQCRSIVVTQGFIKQEWGKRMTGLDLTGNRLFHLPNFFADFTLLTELLLANNDLCKLPRWIGKLQNLRVLDATNNSIRSVPDSCYQLENLHTLNLSKNNISKVPIFLGHMPQLIVLSVSSNPVINAPRATVENAEYGEPCMIEFLRCFLDRIVLHQMQQENIQVPESYVTLKSSDITEEEDDTNLEEVINALSPNEISAVNNRKAQILEGRECSAVKLSEAIKSIVDEPKELSAMLEPSCNVTCLAITKVSDSIWCGSSKGLVHIWDSRTCKFSEKLEVHNSSIVCIIEIPFPHLEAWSADTTGIVNIYDLRKKKSMKLEVFELPISAMAFVKESEEMWVASGTSIYIVSVRTRAIQQTRNISVDAPIRGLVTCGKHVWVSLQTGIIIIFCNDGTQLRTLCAHGEPILAICNAGDFVWTATKSEIKIWKIQTIKFGVFIVACHDILPLEHANPPFVASKDDNYVFTAGGVNYSGTVMQYTASGELVNCFSNQHPPEEKVCALAFTVSPDRLWSVATDGIICYYELKRGKKTIQRLQEQNIEGELGIVTDVKSLESLRMEVSESDEEDQVDFEKYDDENDSGPVPPPMEPHPAERNHTDESTERATDNFMHPKTRVSMVEWDLESQ